MPRGGRCCLRSQVLGYQKIPPREWKPHCDPVMAQRRPRVGLHRPRISRLTAERGGVVFERDPPAAPHTQEQPGFVWGLQTLPYCHHHPITMPAVTWEHPLPEQALSVCLLFQSFLSNSFRERRDILVRTDFRTLRFHHKDVSGASEGN